MTHNWVSRNCLNCKDKYSVQKGDTSEMSQYCSRACASGKTRRLDPESTCYMFPSEEKKAFNRFLNAYRSLAHTDELTERFGKKWRAWLAMVDKSIKEEVAAARKLSSSYNRGMAPDDFMAKECRRGNWGGSGGFGFTK